MARSAKKVTSAGKTQTIEVTREEIEHLLTIFSVIVPSQHENTLTAKLAEQTGALQADKALWTKIWDAAVAFGIDPEESPDYAIVPSSIPEMTLTRVVLNQEIGQ